MIDNDENLNNNKSLVLNQVPNHDVNTYYNTLDENFNNALMMFEKNFSTTELLDMLANGNIVQKQIAALKLVEIRDTTDAIILVQNLVGQDGKVREAVSLKVNELVNNPLYAKFFQTENIYDTFLESIMDVNGNVCRNIITAITHMKSNLVFCKYFTDKLVLTTTNLIKNIEKFDFQEGKYKVNKEVFKLYWALETIYEFIDCIEFNALKRILLDTNKIDEYTIREKTAKILTKEFEDAELNEIRNKLKKDKNYYVRRF